VVIDVSKGNVEWAVKGVCDGELKEDLGSSGAAGCGTESATLGG
jgi:hypothetical protein